MLNNSKLDIEIKQEFSHALGYGNSKTEESFLDASERREFISLYIYDLIDQSIVWTNCPIASLLGYEPQEIKKMGPTGLANLIHNDDLPAVAAHYRRYSTLRPDEIISIKYRMLNFQGRWVQIRSRETVLVQAADGFPLRVLGVIRVLPQDYLTKEPNCF
ncbi:MAG TPA: PAS domain-containing protein [Stenomitos sp.]